MEVDYKELVSVDASSVIEDRSTNESCWLAMLHLSGILLLVLPPLFIWVLKKDKIPNIRSHAIDVINFQLSMYVYLIFGALLVFVIIGIPILIFLGFYSLIIIIINTAKAANNQPYRYPLSIKFLKR